MLEKIKSEKKLEYITLFLFVLTYCIITVFHEPWFDEAQAWQIAKCASLKEMIFEIPHYEGHPPLWWIILAVPAKLGVPFEIGLKTIGLLISTTSAILMIFHSKLPRVVRLTIPFTYFFFYQYGVIVRPYGLMLLCFLLLGMNLPQRKEHPWRIFALLLLLCLTSAYGILLSGGISLCILWEIFREKGFKSLFCEVFTDSRTRSLLVLLVVALLLIVEIMPRSDTYVSSANAQNPFWLCLLATLFTLPGECFLTFGSWFSIDTMLLQHVKIPFWELTAFCIIGIILWIMIFCASSKKGLKFLLIPYFFFAVFAAKVYFSAHHLGIVFILMLFWVELMSRDEMYFEIGKIVLSKLSQNDRDKRILRKGYILICCFCMVVPIVWTICASVNDIRVEYSYGRRGASFLKEHKLDDTIIFCQWENNSSVNEQSNGHKDYVNTYMIGIPVVINAYFPNNISANLNLGDSSKAYMKYKIANYKESLETIAQWRGIGTPDVIIGKPDLDIIFGDRFTYKDYTLVDVFEMNYTWKLNIRRGSIPVYVRNDLLEKHHLKPLDDDRYNMIYNGFKITEEMRQDYENGVPMEEILKPYLDVMFGPEE